MQTFTFSNLLPNDASYFLSVYSYVECFGVSIKHLVSVIIITIITKENGVVGLFQVEEGVYEVEAGTGCEIMTSLFSNCRPALWV